ncbi:Signal transduction histidine kinase [Streptoalloteichus tenebrarius]|uniref:histidine kinase n=1 Tax=Streptoalloteichus tenebrarius (strain ATCC 17920 / DSM 40477 / JCM 4838 / CBS 697.72 / NBRC 16177 / NCIMB 11028 / NRRL B-12390 / A12253. 1 / ISP 5477) TaxID=1933 RepID=A0ABT1HS64_STRSD|nr:histidine kinase [Streptoalloteichus tenebrarius]MCP2258360.1 Signal transduction histidine kinase [Streptoalloteichus tenebrarius]
MPGVPSTVVRSRQARAWLSWFLRSLVPPRPIPRRRLFYELFVLAMVLGPGALFGLVDGETSWLAFAVALPLTLVLTLLRLRFPAFALLATGALSLLSAGTAAVLIVVASYGAGYRVTRWWRLLLAVGGVMACQITSAAVSFEGSRTVLFIAVAFLVMAVVLPALMGRYRAQRRALVDALRERNAHLERERVVVAEQARLRERTRIARDMHDSLGHQLTLVSLHAGALEMTAALPEQQMRAVRVLREATQSAMQELRQIIGVLTQEGDAERGAAQTLADVDELVTRSRQAGMDVLVERVGRRRTLPALTEQAAFRVLQEGLTNAHKYAPGARVRVVVEFLSSGLRVAVANTAPTGPTPDGVSSGGQGLIGLRERVAVAGGELTSRPTADGGFVVEATLPEQPPADAEPVRAASPLPHGREPEVPAPAPPDLPRASTTGLLWAIAGTLLVVFACFVMFLVAASQEWDNIAMVRSTYDRIAVGQPENELEPLPNDAAELWPQARQAGSPLPVGVRCAHYKAADEPVKNQEIVFYRVCFRDGRVAHKEIVRASE